MLDKFLRQVAGMYQADTGSKVRTGQVLQGGAVPWQLDWASTTVASNFSSCGPPDCVLPTALAPAWMQLVPSAEAAPVASVVSIPSEWQQAELAVDGPSLTVVLGDNELRHKLAVLAAHCSGVVVSRSSPSQKARCRHVPGCGAMLHCLCRQRACAASAALRVLFMLSRMLSWLLSWLAQRAQL